MRVFHGHFAGLAPPANVVNTLQSVYNVAAGYVASTKDALGVDTSGAAGGLCFGCDSATQQVAGLEFGVQQLNFASGTGAQMANGSFAWQTYRDQLTGLIQSTLQVQQENGLDTTVLSSWYSNVAAPQLALLTVSGAVQETAGDTANIFGGGLTAFMKNLPGWVWPVGLGAAALWTLSEVNKFRGAARTVTAGAGLAGYKRKRARR